MGGRGGGDSGFGGVGAKGPVEVVRRAAAGGAETELQFVDGGEEFGEWEWEWESGRGRDE